MAIPTKTDWRRVPRRTLAVSLSLLLFAASLSKLWAGTRFPQPPRHSWIESPSVSDCGAICEAALAVVLLAGLWPRRTWLVAVSIFSLFALITAIEAIQGRNSCGCFGAVQIRPIYTMFLDLTAVALLLATGPPPIAARAALALPTSNQQPPTTNLDSAGRRSERRRQMVAGAIAIAWIVIFLAMWMTRPVIAVAATAAQGQTFGSPGQLVVLEPEKWTGQLFRWPTTLTSGRNC